MSKIKQCKICRKSFTPKSQRAMTCSLVCRDKYFVGEKAPGFRYGGEVQHKNEWNSWRAMKSRCYYKGYRRYDRYGGRGIKMCDRWLGPNGFPNFLEDMGKKPTPRHTIDRIDNDGDYTPENCRWSTQQAQVRNSTTTKMLRIGDKIQPLTYWLDEFKVPVWKYYKVRKPGQDPIEVIMSISKET